jgi:hypothetical protein
VAKGRHVARGDAWQGATRGKGRRERAMRRGRCGEGDAARAKVTRNEGRRVAKGGRDRDDAWRKGDAKEATRGEGRREMKGRAGGVM